MEGYTFSHMKLNKKYMAFYKTWLTIFATTAILNVIIYNFFIGQFYRSELSKIGLERIDRDKPLLEIQLTIYAVLTAIIIFFILKSIRQVNRKEAGALYGALMGIGIFLTHNIFNYALLKDWSTALVIVDASWGILQGIFIGVMSVILYDRFNT